MKRILYVLILPLLAFTIAHKYYVSVTHINYSEKDTALQITSRLFIDDVEKVLTERYGIAPRLATDSESPLAADYLEKYIRTKLVLLVNNEVAKYAFLGTKYDADMVVCYIEIPKVKLKKLNSIEIQNELLTDLFEEQQNIVHIKVGNHKKSFVLMRDNSKALTYLRD